MEWSVGDIQCIADHGLSLAEVERQLMMFRNGVSYANLDRPAVPDDGILVFSQEQKEYYAALFTERASSLDIVKFVPASGAATRMFRDLYAFVETGKTNASVEKFFSHLRDFAFFEELKSRFGYPGDEKEIIQFLLGQNGMRFGELPKGLLPFHQHEGRTITPIESHIHEAAAYSDLKDGTVALHFTVSPEHLHEAEQMVWRSVFELEDKFGVESFIQLSEQESSTDTIAVDQNNHPFRNENGDLVFRPGGHGSLLVNLNSTEADLIFVRNIDNILPPSRNTENIFYKKVLGGYALYIQEKIAEWCKHLQKDGPIDPVFSFVNEHFQAGIFPSGNDTNDRKRLFDFLHRPIRVCGMVKNEGEPGGGPFYVKNNHGQIALQIVESSQVSADPKQQEILRSATHFNPVDMVCAIRDFRGELFDLSQFIDPSMSLIVEKSMGGKILKALEHPGLWNGSMADWITVFVEIPVSTFNPVKTVNDLLKPSHQK